MLRLCNRKLVTAHQFTHSFYLHDGAYYIIVVIVGKKDVVVVVVV